MNTDPTPQCSNARHPRGSIHVGAASDEGEQLRSDFHILASRDATDRRTRCGYVLPDGCTWMTWSQWPLTHRDFLADLPPAEDVCLACWAWFCGEMAKRVPGKDGP